MGKGFIRLGDPTSHGGKVVSATARMTVDGIPVALWGDTCTCPITGHTNCVICEGEPGITFDGIPVALDGHKTSCGATLISTALGRCESMPVATGGGAASSLPAAQEVKGIINSNIYDQYFLLKDAENGEVLADMPYELITSSGKRLSGKTNTEGYTDKIAESDAVDVKITIFEKMRDEEDDVSS